MNNIFVIFIIISFLNLIFFDKHFLTTSKLINIRSSQGYTLPGK